MRLRGSYPHPVLDASDDVLADFTMKNAKVDPFAEHIDISFVLELTDAAVQELILAGAAHLTARIKCSSTFYTRAHRLAPFDGTWQRGRYRLTIPQEDVSGEVEVGVKVVAADAVSAYRPANLNPEYADATFDLLAGDVVADAGYFTFVPRKSYDPMNPPIESCFSIVASSDPKGPMKVDLSGAENVEIRLPKETFEAFRGEQGRPAVQVALVVFPALVEVLWRIRSAAREGDSGADDFEDRLWFRAIKNTLDRLGIVEADPLIQAQRILDNEPVAIALTNLAKEEDE